MESIVRPQAATKKINHKDNFELCYLRHQYLRRVKFQPTEDQLKVFDGIVYNFGKNTYYTYQNLFKLVGMGIEDVLSVGKVQAVSFVGLYALEQQPEKREDFVSLFSRNRGKDPGADDMESKDKANFTMFLKQRMEDLVRVCRQKARNIKGLPTEDYYIFYGPNKPPKYLRLLLENHEKYKFKKLDMGSFKSIKKRQKIKGNGPFKFAGSWYVAVPLEQRSLSIEDFAGADLDPYDSIHNKNPEELYSMYEQDNLFEERRNDFDSKSDHRKMAIVQKFINENKSNPLFEDEIRLARQYIKDLRN